MKMPVARTDAFAEPLAMLADTLKAIAHPARLAILQTLAARGTCVCGEVVDELPLAQSTVSQHLKVLREAGLIRGDVDGPRSCYCLDGAAIERLRRSFGALVDELADGLTDDTCAR